MKTSTCFHPVHMLKSGALCQYGTRVFAPIVAAAALLAASLGCAAAAPATGDTYVYRIINKYNNETRGTIQYRVDKIDADRVVLAVTTDTPSAGAAHTEVYTKEGNGLHYPLINHDQPVEYDFTPAFPAYEFPLEVGKSWSVRVNAVDGTNGRRNSVRIDGEVLGSERISTSAGTFDTIKIKRKIYAGDWESFRRETHITEYEWYAPALGRAVRTERNSGYLDPSRCGRMACDPIRGDWNLFELVEASTAKR